jgi:hypothetical protein
MHATAAWIRRVLHSQIVLPRTRQPPPAALRRTSRHAQALELSGTRTPQVLARKPPASWPISLLPLLIRPRKKVQILPSGESLLRQ